MNRCMRPLIRQSQMNSNLNIKLSDIKMNQRAHFANCVNPADKDPKIIECLKPFAVKIAADRLHSGKVIALPTDTVYGLACSANDQLVIQKLYEIKGRNEEKPVAVYVSSIAQLKHYSEADHLSEDLLRRLLPGAVTIILNKSIHLNNPFLSDKTSFQSTSATEESEKSNESKTLRKRNKAQSATGPRKKLFECEHCSMTFAHAGHLRRHFNRSYDRRMIKLSQVGDIAFSSSEQQMEDNLSKNCVTYYCPSHLIKVKDRKSSFAAKIITYFIFSPDRYE